MYGVPREILSISTEEIALIFALPLPSMVNKVLPLLSAFTLKLTISFCIGPTLTVFSLFIEIAPSPLRLTLMFACFSVPLNTVTGTSISSPRPNVLGNEESTIKGLVTLTLSSLTP